ncbi:hypothetical protein BDV96DRAFT_486277 [Lophiotrema nucula]|uniref:Uncharacterized protein n=1 Tax=Lophiotrema nucula TaxID=690887 RepID=A0A6A5ZKZ9_9PLEO|nr:hypothetical protein BDV96DRAFT_486277 [Lophiotrema nucula]
MSQLQQERELEYKHRHTFIGTTSLDDFLELLDVSSAFNTNRFKVTKAFVTLAAKEQAMAREQSTNSEGWELIPRVTSIVADILDDYLAQSRIKLGSISLNQFLGLLRFERDGGVDAIAAVEAFCAAAHIDTRAADGAMSKAKVFRSWVVRQAQVHRT